MSTHKVPISTPDPGNPVKSMLLTLARYSCLLRYLPVWCLILLGALATACSSSGDGSPTSPTSTVTGASSSIPALQPTFGIASESGPSDIGPPLQAHSCTREGSLRSIEYTTATTLEFVNKSSTTKSVYWLNYTGQRVLYGTLPPGWRQANYTYVTHPWVVTDEAGTCVAIFMPAAGPATATIEDANATPALTAAVAASLAQETNRAFDAALRAALGIASLEPARRETFFASLLGALLPTPVHAQTFGGFAPCRNAGTVSITGDATPTGGRVSLRGVSVHYSTCSFPLVDATRNRVITFSGTTIASGTWTADDADNPVTMTGSLDVNEIGPVTISCTSLSTEAGCNGNVGGHKTGPKDTAPPPNPPHPGAAKYDGVYDFFMRFPTGLGTSSSQTVLRFLTIRNSIISSADGTFSGAVDGSGGVRFTGPCVLNTSTADWKGNMNWQAPAGSNSGEGGYECRMPISGPQTWRITQAR